MFEEDSKIMAKLRRISRELGTERYTVCMARRLFEHNPKAFASYLRSRDLGGLPQEKIDKIIADDFVNFQNQMGPRTMGTKMQE